MTRLRRSCSGQASAEYVAVVLAVAFLVAAAVTAAVALNPPFGRQVAATVRQGICIVWSGVCTPRDARAAGFAPCPIHVRRDEEHVTARLVVLRLRHGNALAVERRSDGTVSVSFIDEEELGGQLRAGAKSTAIGVDLSAGADAGLAFTKGKTWEFADQAAAERFVRRYADREGLGGERRAVERFIDRDKPEGPRLPPAHTVYYEAGPYADLSAGVSLGLPREDADPAPARREGGQGGQGGEDADPGEPARAQQPEPPSLPVADASSRGLAVLGRSRRGRRTTWYVKASAEVAGQLGAVVGSLHGAGRGEAVLEVAFEDGQPVELRARGSAAADGSMDLRTGERDLPGVAQQLRGATGRAGSGAIEAEVALDLRDPANRAAVAGLLAPGTSAAQWHASLRTLAARFDAAGRADVRIYSLEREEDSKALLDLPIDPGVGGEQTRIQEVRRLTRGWSLAPGGDLRERADCAEAARPDAVSASSGD